MVARTGRDLILKKGGTAIGAQRVTGFTVDGSPVDITSKTDGGYRRLAGFAGVKSLDINVEGVWVDQVLSDLALGTGSLLLTDVTLEDGVDVISGDFYLANFEASGEHDGEQTYTATLQSSGQFTATAI
jgi:predicted secreted protein